MVETTTRFHSGRARPKWCRTQPDVKTTLLGLAKGNALAQTIAAAHTLRATAATAPSSLASLDNVHLDQIIAAAKAAKVAKAADAAAAQAQAAVPAAAAPAAQ